jgi:hypothetical protein
MLEMKLRKHWTISHLFLLKRRYIRRKYAVKNHVEDATGNIIIADLPPRPLPKAIAEASLLAYL